MTIMEEKRMISYKTIDNFKPGLILQIIKASYQDLIGYFPDEKQRLYSQWEKEDMDAFNNPDTIGKHVLFTCIKNKPIGYFSWDDRQYTIGIIGQNCVLPNYQGKGYGKKQIEVIIRLFQENKFKEITTITGDHQFFLSSQKMYIGCGFSEQKKIKGDLFNKIEFSKLI
jgi:GNAT superfamily N-acetyltransferase